MIELIKWVVAWVTTNGALVIMWMNYNKRKIEEAKENSVGREKIENIQKQIDDKDKRDQEFKKDVFEMLFSKQIKSA